MGRSGVGNPTFYSLDFSHLIHMCTSDYCSCQLDSIEELFSSLLELLCSFSILHVLAGSDHVNPLTEKDVLSDPI
jgi:hypothetical protein